MRIFLLPTRRNRYMYYFEEEPAPADDRNAAPAEPTGRLKRLKAKLVDGYKRLEKKRPIAERLCSRLRKLESIEAVYPEGMSEAEVRESFFNFLRRQAKHERSWKNRDTVLACLGAPLFFLPGPNVWFYYPAVRALGHYYAESGCKKFLSAVEDTQHAPRIQFTPSPELAEVKRMLEAQGRKRLDKHRIAQIGQELGLNALLSLYEKRKA